MNFKQLKSGMMTSNEDSKPSPEIKKIVDKLTPLKVTASAQDKYQSVLVRKAYDHHCFLECVSLRLDFQRGTQTTSGVQKEADKTFISMLEHSQ